MEQMIKSVLTLILILFLMKGFQYKFWGLTEIDFNSESFIYLRNDNLENQPIIYVRHSENDVNHDNISIRGTLNEVNIPIELPEQEWFYFTLSLNRINPTTDLISIYLNGESIHESEVSSFGVLNFSDEGEIGSGINIAAAPQVEWDYLQGSVDNVQIWNIYLNSEQINQYMICPPSEMKKA